jgi:isocitrate dehydrogenase kinase/phosphatase
VTTKILHRNYFHNDFIFVRPTISTENLEGDDSQTYRSYYAKEDGLRGAVRKIVADFDWHRPFADLERDVEHVYVAVHRFLNGMPRREVNFQIQVLGSAFYRNKAAYIIGKAINGDRIPVRHPGPARRGRQALSRHHPARRLADRPALLAVARLLHGRHGSAVRLRPVPALDPAGQAALRAVHHARPRQAGQNHVLPRLHLSPAPFGRQIHHGPRHPRLVMLVFTLPSYPYVFKIIKDVFGASKNMDHATVKRKFMMVKQVDRVGRMADTLEFSNVMFPLNRFDDEVMEELRTLAPSCFEIDGDQLIIKHLYIERRMEPLNIHLDRMERANNDGGLEHAIKEYGSAIREMAQANIFPGDMLWKNFGVTRYGRVVFYDYDEIEYMTDCNFRKIPPAPDFETEMSGEVWYPVAKNDVFPEEFATFLLASPVLRKVFHKHHNLLSPKFWQDAQEKIREGHVEDFFPYPVELRFCNTIFDPV